MSIPPKRYRILFRERAKQEVELAQYLGESFTEMFSRALEEIAEDAANNGTPKSVDYVELLEKYIELAESDVARSHIAAKWRDTTTLEKIKAVIFIAKNRKSPWEIRGEIRWFRNILGVIDLEVHFVYEVDHVNKQVIFVKFTGLPG